jgi:hypothetical protein
MRLVVQPTIEAVGKPHQCLSTDKIENAISLSEYATTWLETRVKLQLAPRTYEHYKHSLKRHILPRFGKMNLHEIRLNLTDRFMQELAEAGHNARAINLII